ncbi:MAG: hypothetical protein LUH43_02990 [Clostridia bacterium]|nr:hypothetical protein [Clostridia bacterium]
MKAVKRRFAPQTGRIVYTRTSDEKFDPMGLRNECIVSPLALIEHLTLSENGEVIVDRRAFTSHPDDERIYQYAFSDVYGWERGDDWEHTTIYFKVSGDEIYGGLYNVLTKKARRARLISTSFETDNPRVYKTKGRHYNGCILYSGYYGGRFYEDDETMGEIIYAIEQAQRG